MLFSTGLLPSYGYVRVENDNNQALYQRSTVDERQKFTWVRAVNPAQYVYNLNFVYFVYRSILFLQFSFQIIVIILMRD